MSELKAVIIDLYTPAGVYIVSSKEAQKILNDYPTNAKYATVEDLQKAEVSQDVIDSCSFDVVGDSKSKSSTSEKPKTN